MSRRRSLPSLNRKTHLSPFTFFAIVNSQAMPSAAAAASIQIGDQSSHQMARAEAAMTTSIVQCMPRESVSTGPMISATTAGRMPFKAASTTGFWRMPAKKMAIARMMTNDGVTVPSRAAAAPRSPRTL